MIRRNSPSANNEEYVLTLILRKLLPCLPFRETGHFYLQIFHFDLKAAGTIGGVGAQDQGVGNAGHDLFTENGAAKIVIEVGGWQHHPIGILWLICFVVGDQGG